MQVGICRVSTQFNVHTSTDFGDRDWGIVWCVLSIQIVMMLSGEGAMFCVYWKGTICNWHRAIEIKLKAHDMHAPIVGKVFMPRSCVFLWKEQKWQLESIVLGFHSCFWMKNCSTSFQFDWIRRILRHFFPPKNFVILKSFKIHFDTKISKIDC